MKLSGSAAIAAMAFSVSLTAAAADRQAMIDEAASAAPPEVAANATIMDWDGNTLRPGSNGFTCYPTPPDQKPPAAMCLDGEWMKWGDAWMNRTPFQATRVGTAYMLAGDSGSSNIDPFATGPTPDNDWVVEGPHLMIIVPDPATLEGISTDPHNGGPYVMWKGTPYAHIMVPVGGK